MPEWLAQMFGQVVDGIGHGIADARDKIVFGGFFNLHTPERNRSNEQGWSQDHRSDSEQAQKTALDRFYDRLTPVERAEHFHEKPAQDRGIER